MVMAYHRAHALDTRIVRIFNTFGPGQRREDGRAVTTFIVQALAGKPITVHGDGTQTRSFTYVDDLIEGIVRLLRSGYTEPVNIGNPEEYTILDLAEMIREIAGSSSEIVFEPRPVDDPAVRRPDITRAKEVLGWEPTVPVREGLKRTIEWFRTEP
jgi:dTDP-glucose 4,6-dehydratase